MVKTEMSNTEMVKTEMSNTDMVKTEVCTKGFEKITSVEFILDLALMCDSLQELSELSFELQEKEMDIYKGK